MNRYSKINCSVNSRSRSIDFSDVLPFPETPRKSLSSSNTKTQETNNSHGVKEAPKNTQLTDSSFSEHEEDGDVGGKRFGQHVVLSRSSSVSATTTPPASTGVQCAVKRAFSMRRSSSVSEGYSRIHHQSVTLASPIEDDEDDEDTTARSAKKKMKKKNKILKVCKRLFGL